MADLATLWPVVGGAGAFGILVVVIVALLRAQAAAARQYTESTTAEGERTAKAIADAEARADAAEQREQAIRDKADARETHLQEQLDDALAQRRRAEDMHAQVLMEVRQLRHKVEHLERQLLRFTQPTGADPI